jgi:hypothetical protein
MNERGVEGEVKSKKKKRRRLQKSAKIRKKQKKNERNEKDDQHKREAENVLKWEKTYVALEVLSVEEEDDSEPPPCFLLDHLSE